jgi:hypothetical protein
VVLADGSVLVLGGSSGFSIFGDSGDASNEVWKSSNGGGNWTLLQPTQLTNTDWGTNGKFGSKSFLIVSGQTYPPNGCYIII